MINVKKILISFLIITTIVYFPMTLIANASEEQMMEEARMYFDSVTPIRLISPEGSISNRAVKNDSFDQNVTRGGQITLTRTSLNNGISLFMYQGSGYNVQVCIFTEDMSQILGDTFNFSSGQWSTANWTKNVLGNHQRVVLFFSCHHDVTYNVEGSIVY